MRQLDFNTLDRLVASDQWKALSSQAIESIRQMQTEVPQFGIQPHVVLPVFQKKEQTQYVLATNGEQRGPFSLEQVKQLLKADAITPYFYVWTQGWPEWKFIKDCPELTGGMQ
jgi:hypothetical protein